MKIIDCPNVINFREFGGYITKDGRKVKEGLIYRSAGFYKANDDIELLRELNVKHVVDYRETFEFKEFADKFPEFIKLHEIPAMVENEYTLNKTLNFMDFLHDDMDAKGMHDANSFLREVYTFMAFDNIAFKETFKLIEQKEAPLLFHCAGGKDRTGIMSALWLTLLGVDKETVMEDYLYSNNFCGKDGYVDEQLRIKNITNPETIQLVWDTIGVKREYLESMFDSIAKKYKNMDEYFLFEYGLDEKKITDIRNFYLEEN